MNPEQQTSSPSIQSDPQTVRATLRLVGIVLVVVGLADIGWMIYAITSGKSYSSSFNIFAVVAGIFLIRQSPRAARIVTLFSGFYFAGFASLLPCLALAMPWGLIWVYLRTTPITSLLIFAVEGLLWWVYRSLARPDIQSAVRLPGPKGRRLWRHPTAGLWIGAAFGIILISATAFTGRSASSQEAISRARTLHGTQYRYFVSSLSKEWTQKTGTHVHALVLAYNDETIDKIEVEWQE
jgi:uncharacterized protein YjeT (DUF2065 family)